MKSVVTRLAVLVCLLALPTTAAHAVNIGTLHCNDASGTSLNVGAIVTITGVVTGSWPTATSGRFYVQDATGGINVFGAPPQFCGSLGDQVQVTGTISQFNGLVEVGNPLTIVPLSSGNPQPPPLQMSPNQMNATYQADNCEPNESRLVQVQNVYIRTATGGMPGPTYAGNTNYMLIDAAPDSALNNTIMRDVTIAGCSQTNPLTGQPIPLIAVDVIGVVNQFVSTAPFTSGYQLQPRAPADVSPTAVTPTTPSSWGRLKSIYR